MFIAKIQRSLVSTDGVQRVLIYNQSRTIQHETDIIPEIDKLFGKKDKIYAKCKLNAKGVIEINGLVKDQKW